MKIKLNQHVNGMMHSLRQPVALDSVSGLPSWVVWAQRPLDPAWTTDDDRRSSNRVRVSVAVKQRMGDRVYVCQAGDLSSKGMLLARLDDDEFDDAKKCWLEFGLPGYSPQIAARGHVVRHHRRGKYQLMGVRFASIAPSHRRLIDNYIQCAPFPEPTQVFETV